MTNKQIQRKTKEIMKANKLSELTASLEIGIHRNTLHAFLIATEAVEDLTISKIEQWIINRAIIHIEDKP